MRFLLHGIIHPDTQAALTRHEQVCHLPLELSADTDAPGEILSNPELLFPLLQIKQWQLITTDTELVQQLYEKKIDFPGIIVLLLESRTSAEDANPIASQAKGIDRLFERYPRLTPRRLYTVTPNRVKIRQLPGAGQA